MNAQQSAAQPAACRRCGKPLERLGSAYVHRSGGYLCDPFSDSSGDDIAEPMGEEGGNPR